MSITVIIIDDRTSKNGVTAYFDHIEGISSLFTLRYSLLRRDVKLVALFTILSSARECETYEM